MPSGPQTSGVTAVRVPVQHRSSTRVWGAYGGTLSAGTINTQLNMGNVVVQTSSGDIVVDATGVAIAPTGDRNANTLTLDLFRDVTWNGDWSYTNNGRAHRCVPMVDRFPAPAARRPPGI